MARWIPAAVLAALIAFVGYAAYDYYRAGFHTRPDMPEGAFSLSYRNGLRAIVVGVKDERPERKYLGVPFKVPPWFEDTWSFCSVPTAAEQAELSQKVDLGPAARLEGVCRITADEAKIYRGAIYSVPNL
jgi:hypothetical protein